MEFLKKIGSYFGRRKAKVFLLTLLASFMAWFISNLSGIYDAQAVFDLAYENVPDTLLVRNGVKRQLQAKVRASGFRLLSYNLGPKQIAIDVSEAQKKDSRFFLSIGTLSEMFERQLGTSVEVLDYNRDTFFLDVYQVAKKEVPIQLDINLKLSQNHILEGGLNIEPKLVEIKGPKNEIAQINKIKTARINLDEVTSDFAVETNLVRPEKLENSELLKNSVVVSGKVMRFSEKVYQIDIRVINIPDGYSAETFPSSVPILCKASIEELKVIKKEDFELIADYDDIQTDNKVVLKLEKSPKGAYDVRIKENRVTLILEEK